MKSSLNITIQFLIFFVYLILHNKNILYFKVYEVLAKFNIKKKQIYTITTDNARNFVKMVDLIKCDNDEDVEGKK